MASVYASLASVIDKPALRLATSVASFLFSFRSF